jgi:hypothetical protein
VLAVHGAPISVARALLVVIDALVNAAAHRASSTLVPDAGWTAVLARNGPMTNEKTQLTRGSERVVSGSNGCSPVRRLLSTTKTKVVSRTSGSMLVVDEAAPSSHASESSTTGRAAMNDAFVASTHAIATRADAIDGPTDALESLAYAIARSTGPLERSADAPAPSGWPAGPSGGRLGSPG